VDVDVAMAEAPSLSVSIAGAAVAALGRLPHVVVIVVVGEHIIMNDDLQEPDVLIAPFAFLPVRVGIPTDATVRSRNSYTYGASLVP